MLVYKQKMHFWAPFRDDYVKTKFLFQSNTLEAKNNEKDLKLKDRSKRLLVQSIRVKPQNTIKIGISKKNLKHLVKKV